ncbi:unnamed protein product [Didymodactylos carnosus]|uniref:Transposase n=1 Tax=Didymodactylos carnosus TaxID=1234261 RepID=A0A814S3T3_9BILA|nr:unnamed protein product [Didymodactylos carnosus]CAF3904838.1 unnamed protein product [Didymodactylos carnosus]
MNLVNIAKHLLHLTQMQFHLENSTTTEDDILASQQLFEISKTFKDGHFNELHIYQTLDFSDEYDEMMDGEDSSDEEESTDEEQNVDDYDESEYLDIQNNFTLEEMKDIVEWVDQHPNYKIASIRNRFRKVKHTCYITRFREYIYIERNDTKSKKLKKVKEFMWNEFWVKRIIGQEAIHDSDLELFVIQKARELGWDNFKASESFITRFKREHRISSRRHNKLVTRISSRRKTCSLKGL